MQEKKERKEQHKKTTVRWIVAVDISHPHNLSIQEAMLEVKYDFKGTTKRVKVLDSETLDWDVVPQSPEGS